MSALTAEALPVSAFVATNRRQRWLQGLGHPKARAKVLARLAASEDFLDAWYHPLRLSGMRDEQVRALLAMLGQKGASTSCHVLSQDDEVDGRVMPLEEAIERSIDDGGALLVCTPGHLALHFPETPEPPAMLARP